MDEDRRTAATIQLKEDEQRTKDAVASKLLPTGKGLGDEIARSVISGVGPALLVALAGRDEPANNSFCTYQLILSLLWKE